MKKISEVLRTFRSSREMTANDLATILDCSNQFISKLEQGIRTISIEKVKLLKDVMTPEEYKELVEAVVSHKLRDLEDDFEFEIIQKEGMESSGENKQKELNFAKFNTSSDEEETQDEIRSVEVIEGHNARELEEALAERINAGRVIEDIKYQVAPGIRSAVVIYEK